VKNTCLSVHTLAATFVIGMLGVVSVTEAHAEEIASSVYRQTAKSPVSIEALENYTLEKLTRVYFGSEKSDLTVEEKAALDDVVRRFSGSTESVVELRGYMDGLESAQDKTGLDATRSQTVARYLTRNGIPADRILLVAPGWATDGDPQKNPEHRRVDVRVFTVVGSGGNTAHSDSAANSYRPIRQAPSGE